MATLAAVTNMPALALLAEDGKLERSTDPARRWLQEHGELCLQSPELKRVLEGQANAAVMKLDGVAVDIAAMADRSGGRHVLLTLPTEELPSIGDAGGALLDGALDDSPALVWLKDLEGRYVRANARFTTLLSTSEERLLGRTDAELPPAETVDGPRVQDRGDDAVEEPLHLEYFVGPFQGREALVVLRFPVVDREGVPTLVCGVAAPSSEAQVARSEAARLLRIERWSRLDADSVRAELLADWDLLPDARGRSAASAAAPESAPGPGAKEQQAAVAEARAERATAVAERDSALSANDKLTHDLEQARARLADLERALKEARAEGASSDAEVKLAEQAAELERGLVRERERAEELERTLTLVRQRLGDDAEAARVEVQRARADAEAARTEVERARTDAESARGELGKARAEADALRAASAAERETATKATAALEREVKQARDQLAALERQQQGSSDDSGAALRAAEKARVAAEAALAEAVSERDAALKARAAMTGELEQERKQVVSLREGSVAAEERIRELTGGLERERVRAAGIEQVQARVKELEAEVRAAIGRAAKAEGELALALERRQQGSDGSGAALQAAEKARAAAEERIRQLTGDLERERVRAAGIEQAQARVKELEAEVRAAIGRAAKADGELELAAGRVQRAERDLETAVARTEKAEGELRSATMRADKAEIELEQWRARVTQVEAELERGRKRIEELEGKVEAGQSRIVELQGQVQGGQTQIATLQGEVKAGQTRIEALHGELKAGEARIEALRGELEAGQTRIETLRGELEAGQARIETLEEELEDARATAAEADTTIAELETRLEEAAAQTPAEPAGPGSPAEPSAPAEPGAPPEPDRAAGRAGAVASVDEVPASAPVRAAGEAAGAPSEPIVPQPSPTAELARVETAVRAAAVQAGPGVSWQPTAKRTLSASLARESVWRNVLKETVQVLGAEGGWDTVTAWLPDDSNQLGCAATWTAHRGLEQFEAATWDSALRREGSLLDMALQAPHLTWLTDIDAVDDERLQSAAAHGMSSALLLPVRSGTTTVGLLELLTHDAIEPDAQIALSLEAAALQLGRFGHLLSVGGKPA